MEIPSNPIYDELYSSLQSAETSYDILINKLDNKHFKQKAGDPHWYDIVDHDYKTEIPIHLTNLFSFLKMEPADDQSSQVFKTNSGEVYDVVTVSGAIEFLVENADEIKEKLNQVKLKTGFDGNLLSVKSNCNELIRAFNNIPLPE